MRKKRTSSTGFSVIEVLISLAILGIVALSIFMIQTSTWKGVIFSNRLTVAGQMIERQIEQLRMNIVANPVTNFPPHDSSYTENSITLSWKGTPVQRPVDGAWLDHVRQYTFTAAWGKGKADTLRVTTCLAQKF